MKKHNVRLFVIVATNATQSGCYKMKFRYDIMNLSIRAAGRDFDCDGKRFKKVS
jgi:hypothetical protein